MLATSFIFASLFASIVNGLVIPHPSKRESSDFTTLTSTQISSLKPYALFASVAYCKPEEISKWSCGGMSSILSLQDWRIDLSSVWYEKLDYCAANSDFIVTANGGNGDSVQFCKCYSCFRSREWWTNSVICDEGYVGFSKKLGSVIVAHEGTVKTKLWVL